MTLVKEYIKKGYAHYAEYTVEDLDNLSIKSLTKQTEYYLIQKWLREKHDVHVWAYLEIIDNSSSDYIWNIRFYRKDADKIKSEWKKFENASSIDMGMWWKTYEEALEKGLYAALKTI